MEPLLLIELIVVVLVIICYIVAFWLHYDNIIEMTHGSEYADDHEAGIMRIFRNVGIILNIGLFLLCLFYGQIIFAVLSVFVPVVAAFFIYMFIDFLLCMIYG